MPVYFHSTVDKIEAAIRAEGLVVSYSHVDGSGIQTVDANNIKKYLADTFLYFGAYPEYYLLIGDLDGLEIYAVDYVVNKIRSQENRCFALVGYNDGGLFSITPFPMSFQDGEKEAPQWKW